MLLDPAPYLRPHHSLGRGDVADDGDVGAHVEERRLQVEQRIVGNLRRGQQRLYVILCGRRIGWRGARIGGGRWRGI